MTEDTWTTSRTDSAQSENFPTDPVSASSDVPGEISQSDRAQNEDKRFEVKWRKKGESAVGKAAATSEVPAVESEEEVAELRRRLEEERKRADELRDRWQRAAADLVNLRRRTEQEQEGREKMAAMHVVFDLLPVLDNFERALSTIPGNLQFLTWIHGVILIERQLRAILELQGVAPIEAKGQSFSAYYHEAISEQETDQAVPGTVLQEYQRGYTMHGQVIRPALVEVAKAPESPATEAPAFDETQHAPDEVEEAVHDRQGQEIAEQSETENVGP